MYTAVALLALVATAYGAVPMLHMDAEEKIPSEFIVQFKSSLSPRAIRVHMADLKRRLARSHTDSKVMFEYKHTIKGYAIHDEIGDVVTYLQTLDSDIEHIEPNQVAHATMVAPQPLECVLPHTLLLLPVEPQSHLTVQSLLGEARAPYRSGRRRTSCWAG